MNPPPAFVVRFVSLVFVLMLAGCATGPPPKPLPEKAVLTFSEDYDGVWAAVLDTLDLEGFVITQMSKDDGYITTDIKETTWNRTKVSVRLYRREDSVEVKVNSYTEERTASGKDSAGNLIYYWRGKGRSRGVDWYILKRVAKRLGYRVIFDEKAGLPGTAKPLPEKAVLAFSEDYDRVWAAALDTLDRRGFVIARMAKEDGYITTDIK